MSVDVEKLFNTYSPMVLRRCRAMLKNEEAALDAMQDTFVQVLRRKQTLREDAPSSMLYTIATNICLNKIRSERIRSGLSDGEAVERISSGDNPEERALSGHFLERLLESEDRITSRILQLLYIEKWTLTETAADVRFSVSGVRKRVSTLRRKALVLREL